MRIFQCPACGETLFFSNMACACGAEVAYDPGRAEFTTEFEPCANRAEIACNWIAEAEGGLCHACAMTEVIPDTFRGDNRQHWAEAEGAKRWVLANLARWGWFDASDDGPRPVFRLLAEHTAAGDVNVSMGHAEGVVTINVTEADPAERVRRRIQFGEPLRTMIGHFRHELGHFFFERLKGEPGFLDAFRAAFGDERADYAAALKKYYEEGAAPDWQNRHITEYSAAHPHEDWAECFAHLLHLADIIDSVIASGLSTPSAPGPDYDPYAEADAERLISLGAELGIALNHVNRSMGLNDIYPFVLKPPIREKLEIVHGWIRRTRPREARGAA